jgi:hypothetical protein
MYPKFYQDPEWVMLTTVWATVIMGLALWWAILHKEAKHQEELAITPPICLELKSGRVVCGKQTKLEKYAQTTFWSESESYWLNVDGLGEVEVPKSEVLSVETHADVSNPKKGGGE